MSMHPARATRRAVLAALPGAIFLARGPAAAQTPVRIRVAGPANDGFRALYYGVQAGVFRRYGLDVEPVIVTSGAAAVAALVGGSAEIAYTNIITVVQAYRRGIPMRIVAPATLYTSDTPSSSAVLARVDAPIKSGRDLDGKILGTIALADFNAIATLAWVDRTGGDSKTVKLLEIPGSAMLAALEDRRIDAAVANEPIVSQAVASGKVRIVTRPFDSIAKRFESGAYVGLGPDSRNADAFARFARAMHESQLYTNAHLAETVGLVASYSGVAPDVIAHSIRMIDPEYVDPKLIQPVIDVLAKYGQLDKPFPAQEIISSVALKPR